MRMINRQDFKVALPHILVCCEHAFIIGKVILGTGGGVDEGVALHYPPDVSLRDCCVCNHLTAQESTALIRKFGQGEDINRIRQKALKTGAVDAIATDAKNLFVDYFVFPALMAGAIYEGKYPLATALGRPLIAKLMVDAAHEHNAKAVAHGCTGKGNDQVRFDVTFQTLDPTLKIIAPVREWRMTRDEEMKFAAKHGIPVEATQESPYSVDLNLWGRSCEAGVFEDPWDEPPADAFAWTVDPARAPDEPEYLEIEFEQGRPIGIDGQRLDGVPLIDRLNRFGGRHGGGRI